MLNSGIHSSLLCEPTEPVSQDSRLPDEFGAAKASLNQCLPTQAHPVTSLTQRAPQGSMTKPAPLKILFTTATRRCPVNIPV